ncbi:unnamed protein product [Darwinula stevensoni]|uniref:Ionotropic glutamate receptor C-terminal domain-containing protein n=1 Tax=Darwinula stevensoni TaxID=69355 RepID=A0A7R9AD63_9CRUS|nr:unnamed protein product [Darwinula stevensoni]CAG0900995.1 unnamed protein product [Darwinula stevensoni]
MIGSGDRVTTCGAISDSSHEPAYDEPPWYAFARPLTWRVWLCVLGLYVLGSLTLFAASRVSPYERRKGEPTSLGGCFWFMLSSFFLRGATQGPQAWSCRLVAVIWWWFSVLLLFLYVHVVALSYATQETTPPIRAVEDLARQSVVQYGAVGGGATHAFFKAHPENLLRDYEEGVARVKSSNGEFAFFMETLSMEYYLSRHCDLAQLGKTSRMATWYDEKKKILNRRKRKFVESARRNSGSWLMPLMSSALLEMQEDGSLWGLDLKWFHFRNDCREEPGRSPGLTHIDLYNFGGIVFVVLLGLILAILVAFFELCVYSVATVKKGGKTAHTSVRRQMKEEFRESLRLNPPKRPPPPPPVEEMG